MQKYIQQIIFDIQLAESKIPDVIRNRKFISTGGIENALKKAEFKPLEDWIGISKDMFPPVDRLNSDQIDLILEHLMNVLDQYGYFVNTPEIISNTILYTVLIEHLSQETPLLPNHSWQLALCGYDPKGCPFGRSHCQCKNWESILLEFPEMDEEQGLTFVKGFTDEYLSYVEEDV